MSRSDRPRPLYKLASNLRRLPKAILLALYANVVLVALFPVVYTMMEYGLAAGVLVGLVVGGLFLGAIRRLDQYSWY